MYAHTYTQFQEIDGMNQRETFFLTRRILNNTEFHLLAQTDAQDELCLWRLVYLRLTFFRCLNMM